MGRGLGAEAKEAAAVKADAVEGARKCIFDEGFQTMFGGNILADCCELDWDIDCCNPCISM